MDDEIRNRFAQLAAKPDAEIRLDEAALLIAAEAEQVIIERAQKAAKKAARKAMRNKK